MAKKQFFFTKWIRGWRLDKAFEEVKDWAAEIVPVVIDAVNQVKLFDAENPAVLDFITGVIPGTWDDTIVQKFRDAVIKAMPLVVDFSECLQAENVNAMLLCVTKKIQAIPDINVRAQRLANLAALIAFEMEDDNKLDINEVAVIIKKMYDDNK